MEPPDVTPYDAVLLVSFGGPEAPEDVVPFLENVTRGRGIPRERLEEVGAHYHLFGGRSPINDQNREFIAAVRADLDAAGIDLPIYWGNRNWDPYLTDTVQQMADDGIGRALVFVTSAFGSYSGCRQYRQDLETARDRVGSTAPTLQKLRLFYNHPGFIEPMGRHLRLALGGTGPIAPSHRIVFSAHSIPESMAAACSYRSQLAEAAALTMTAAGLEGQPHDIVYQSRSGPPTMPWLEPDVNDHLVALAEAGVTGVSLVPIGFVSDHMEVLFDLDTQAAQTAADLGLRFTRVRTVGTDPRFVTMIRELIEEQLFDAPKLSLGSDGPWPDHCPEGHCIPAARPGRPGQD